MRARILAIAIALSLGAANAPVRADGSSVPPVAALAPAPSPPAPALLPETPPPKPVVKRPIFWIALFGGGAVIAAGITLAVVLGSRASTVTVFPTTE